MIAKNKYKMGNNHSREAKHTVNFSKFIFDSVFISVFYDIGHQNQMLKFVLKIKIWYKSRPMN